MMVNNYQSLLNNLICACFSALTRTNPTSVVIPQAIAMENYCFTTASCDVKNISLTHEDKYLFKNMQQWKIIYK